MKITKKQLKRIIKEEQAPFRHVIGTAKGIFGRAMQIDEESDGNLVIVADEAEVEKHYGELMSAFPNGEMTEDGFVTGEYEDMSRAPFRESKITKRQLRQIIKEEKARLTESVGSADIGHQSNGPGRHIVTIELRITDTTEIDMDYLLNDIDDTLEDLFSKHSMIAIAG